MNRIIKVARMQLINKWTFIGIPLLVLACSFLLTLAIWAIVRRAGAEDSVYSGGAQAPMWYFLALGIQALTLTFPFSMAMSVSRRTFYLGTVALFSVCALALSIFYYLMGLVETATSGWGVNGQFFALGWVAENNAVVQIAFYWVLMSLLFMLGFFSATLYMRWRTTGVLLFTISLAVVLLGTVAIITYGDHWPAVGQWLAAWTAGSVTLLGAGLAVVLAGASYLTLRKATA
ncbi:hypothetical protein AUR04nite_11830 [Glutamicibacter uratoxydans]|uniref:Uncharacterized protein n=1 Tax=Glutamicibacter uratoxydans TaxID=43667 RepID=A0A4Y4DT30_GLUUR|nr:hypothetical protein [Glutamicibacter uratoxydans]GED05651.1 hypothetical protein AUR04nite_11830 [Glutamicibacter uratoxydans]